MKFTTTIVLDGNNTGIEVPADVMSALGTAKRIPVVVTVGGHRYRSSVAPYKGRLMISLSAANREAAGVAGGDEVEVALEPDTAPREVLVPADLARALDADTAARPASRGSRTAIRTASCCPSSLRRPRPHASAGSTPRWPNSARPCLR